MQHASAKKITVFENTYIVIFLGKNEEKKIGFSQKGPINRFGGLRFLATRMCLKKSHKPLIWGIFKNRDLF